MKTKKYAFRLLAILLCPLLFAFSQINQLDNSQDSDFVSKELKSILSKMIFVDGGTFTVHEMSIRTLHVTERDSNLCYVNAAARRKLSPYYVNATEVTNQEWSEFYQAQITELGKTKAMRSCYPDFDVYKHEFPYSANQHFTNDYYLHEKFANHPAIGITWDMANAYCKWKTNQLQKLLTEANIKSDATFRLPTEPEWELAAKTPYVVKEKERIIDRRFYPWSSKKTIVDLNGLTNCGQIHSINGILLKNYSDDGHFYTCEVATYPPNGIGLYNVGGNVSEWTSDDAFISLQSSHLKKGFKKVTSFAEIEQVIKDIKESDLEDYEKAYYLQGLEHNKKVFTRKDLKICKGGSWAEGLIYTQVGSRQAINKNNASSKIGFRIVLSDVSDEMKPYFPKKNWEPKR